MVVYHWILRDSKFIKLSRTLPSIQAGLNNTSVCIFSTYLLFSSVPVLLQFLWRLSQVDQPQLLSQSPSCSIDFFSLLARSRSLLIFSLTFIFHQWPAVTAESTIRHVFFSFFLFCWCWLSLGLVVWSRLGYPFLSKNPRNVCAFYSPGGILVCG